VTIADKDGYKDYLNENRMMLDVCQELVFKLVEELDADDANDELRIQQVQDLESELSQKCKSNAKQVKEMMIQLLTDHEASRPLSGLEENKLDLLQQKDIREKEKEAKMTQENKPQVSLVQSLQKRAPSLVTMLKLSKNLLTKIVTSTRRGFVRHPTSSYPSQGS